jgi:teichuronic acid biosynthesis glycosyltransferase TuaC
VLKILVISHMFPNTMNPVYGVFVLHQVRELINLGHEVMVISPVPWSGKMIQWAGKKWRDYGKIPYAEKWDGVRVFYPRYPVLPQKILYRHIGRSCYWGIQPLVRRIYARFPFEIIHAHTALPDGYAAGLMKKEFGCPVVLTIHGQDIFANVKMGKGCKKAVVKALQQADQIVAVSSRLKKEMASYVNEEKIQVVPNGIIPEDAGGKISDLTARYRGNQVLLSVGYLIHRKGHRYVLEAMRQLKDQYPQLIYLIVGDGSEEALLRKMAWEFGLEEKVHFLGRKSQEDVARYMALADIFVLPSWDEAFGVVYLEAMAQGKPVIGCRGEGIEDIITPGKDGFLVRARDPEDLKSTIDFLLKNEKIRMEAGKAAQKKVWEKFTWTQVALELEQIYFRLT